MDFSIKCDVFNRLAQITLRSQPELSCVRLEYKNGHYYAIATNQEIAAIQYLGQTNQPDSVAHVVNDSSIISQGQTEILYDSSLHIQYLPEFATATLMTTMGWQYQKNACIFPDSTPMDKWLEWFPDKIADKNKGVMYWDIDQIELLARSAPSGKLYFPQFIDINEPVIIRDRLCDTWCGLFVPKPSVTEEPIRKGAEKPTWL